MTAKPVRSQSMGNFPLQTTAYFMAPASQRLSDYFSSDKRLVVDLLLKDLTKTSAQIYLSWSLEAPGLRIQSRQGYIPTSFITLQRGVSLRLHGSDLQASYFQPSAIDAQGIDPSALYTTDLPEGFYTFRVQAIEATTGLPVSNTSETFLVLTAPQPPILNLPVPGTQLPVTALQQVAFLWSPRHFATPTSRIVYQLKVCPVPDDYEPNELVMNNCPAPLLNEQLPTLNFTGDVTRFARPLQVGQRYAVQVTATDLNGQITNFASQGRSQVSWFRYGKACSPPAFTIQSLGSDRVQLSWSPVEEAVGYRVEYKPEAESAWRPLRVSGRSTVIGGLNGTVPYLFRVSSDCGGLSPSAPSEIQRWTIREDTPEPAPLPPLALTNPGLIPVQVGPDGQPLQPLLLSDLYANWPPSAGSSSTGASGSSLSATPASGRQAADSTARLLRQIPRCALLASSFGGCQPDHPSLGLPTGGNELTRLQVGDVLGIYDYAVVVTRVDAANPLAGQGLARLPLLGGTLALVEFAGVQAKVGEAGTSGGCVYSVPPGGYFRSRAASQSEVLAAQQHLLQRLAPPDDSTRYRGTLAQALTAYEASRQALDSTGAATLTASQQQTLVGYVGAIGQGLHTLQQQLDAYYGAQAPLGLVDQQLDQLLTTMDQLRQQLLTSQPVSVSSLSALSGRYQQLVSQLTRMQTPTQDTSTQAAITDVALSQLSSSGVSLSWAGQGSLSRYVVRYQEQNGQDVVVDTRTPGLALSRLKAARPYTFTLEGYGPDGTLQATYGKALFTTPARVLAPPTHLRYSVSSDNTVTIEWDKDKDHRRYQLTYTDPNGVERTFYPTTNQYKLTGLDPAQQYPYQIVAYGEDQLVSPPANGRLSSGSACNLTVTDRNATNWPIITTAEHLLLASGCLDGQLTWANGTAATSTNGSITFADGETAQIGGLFLGDHVLVVNPKKTTTYTAICRVGAGTQQRSCTYSVQVTVSDPACGDDFTIAASATTVAKGDIITLTAKGCHRQLNWSPGLGNDASVRLVVLNELIVSASCSDGHKQCLAKPIPIRIQPVVATCIGQLYLGQPETYDKCGFLAFGCRTVHDIKVHYTGCQGGTVRWTTTGDIRGGLAAGSDYAQLKDVQGPFTVSAVCQPANQELQPCAPLSLTYNDNCLSRSYTLLSSGNGVDNARLLPDKPGYWPLYLITTQTDNTMWVDDQTGNRYNPTAAPVRALYVPKSADDKRYTALIPPLGCQTSLRIPGRAASPPTIQWREQVDNGKPTPVGGLLTPAGDAFDVKGYGGYNAAYQLTMSATGCEGTLVWTTDQDPTFSVTASQLSFSDSNRPGVVATTAYLPFPPVTTTYYASCYVTNADGSQEVYAAGPAKTLLIRSEECLRIEGAGVVVAKGNLVRLKAVGCAGTVSWQTEGQLVGIGAELTHAPLPPAIPAPVRYTATCSEPACTQTVSVSLGTCQFGLMASRQLVSIAESVTLSASGCAGGEVVWGTGQEGPSISVKPLKPTRFTADCIVNGRIICQSATDIAINAAPPTDVSCPQFTLTATPCTISRCTSQTVSVTPEGCPPGSTITWGDGRVTTFDQGRDFSLSQSTTLNATCTTPYQIQAPAQLAIEASELPLTVRAPARVYPGYPVTLTAFGCSAPDCSEGRYSWTDQATGRAYTGSSIRVTLNANTTFTVKCSSGATTTYAVTLDAPCDGGHKTPAIVGNQYLLEATNAHCDAAYAINWYRDEYSAKYGNKSTLITTNVSSISVPYEVCDDFVYVGYHVTCVNDQGIPCTTTFGVQCKEATSGGSIRYGEPTGHRSHLSIRTELAERGCRQGGCGRREVG